MATEGTFGGWRHGHCGKAGAMNEQVALELMRLGLWTAVKVAGPPLLAALAVGVLVSLFSAITQIQEPTLTFLPKLAALALVAVLLGPWMLRSLVAFAVELFRRAAAMGP